MPPKPRSRRRQGNDSSDLFHYNGQVELTFKNKPSSNLDNSSSEDEAPIIKVKKFTDVDSSSSESEDELHVCSPTKRREQDDEIAHVEKVVERPITPPPDQFSFSRLSKKTMKLSRNVSDKLRSLQQVTLEQSPMSVSRLSDVVIVEQDSPASQNNRRFTLKIRTRNGVERFPMAMNEMFDGIIRQLAEKNGVSVETISLSFTDSAGMFQALKGSDSPILVNLSSADILDCVFIHPAQLNDDISVDGENTFNIKIQGSQANLTKVFQALKNEPLIKIMREYATFCKVNLSKLKFYFDGDVVMPTQTPDELDMDEDNVIDVRIT